MNYLAISSKTDRVGYAIFKGVKLIGYGNKPYENPDKLKQSLELEKIIDKIITFYRIDIMVVKWHDYMRMTRGKALSLISFRTILRLVCAKRGVVYLELDSYGWERFLLKDHSKKIKLEVIKSAYGIDLKDNPEIIEEDQESVADTIILGEAIAHQRIKAKPRQPIDFKWGTNYK